MTVGEAFGVEFDQASLFTDARREELSMIFHFDIVRIDRAHWRRVDWTLSQFRAALQATDDAAGQHGWATSFLCNHDNPRTVSHFGDDSPEWRERLGQGARHRDAHPASDAVPLPGRRTGDDQLPVHLDRAVRRRRGARAVADAGRDGQGARRRTARHLVHTSRDHARTPMQWTDGPHGGFTTGTPWLAVNPNTSRSTPTAQRADPDRCSTTTGQLIALRRHHPVLVHGASDDIDPAHERVLGHTRTDGDMRCVVLVHFGEEPISYDAARDGS